MAAGVQRVSPGIFNKPVEEYIIRRWGRMRKDGIKNRTPLGMGWQKVYICSPYAGDVEQNVKKAISYCRYAIAKNRQPVASHLMYPRILNDFEPDEREIGLSFGKALLQDCSEVWVFGRDITDGMRGEIREALRDHIPVVFINAPLAYGYPGWNDRELCLKERGHKGAVKKR